MTILLPVLLFAGCGGGGGSSVPVAARLVSLAVTPPDSSSVAGRTLQLTATGTFANNSTKDVTKTVTWSSSDSTIATVGNGTGTKGTVTTLSAGSTTITATSGTVSAAATLTVTPLPANANVVRLTVNGALCTGSSYPNKACVSVTVCTPGTADCQMINDILLDTGSFGLRVFKQALTVSLPQQAGSALAECVQFADGSATWGPVRTAGIILGEEPQVQVPIQVIDAGFGTLPSRCKNPLRTPAGARFNGILGVGLFVHDCGGVCAGSSNNGIYYTCSGTACTPAAAPLNRQVQNPVAFLPVDNNGVVVSLPSLPPEGSTAVEGGLILGIGTRANNQPGGVTTFPASNGGEFTTTLNGTTYTSFLDTGSNGYFFPAPSPDLLPVCPAPNAFWYCPPTLVNLTATNHGVDGASNGDVPFRIGNFTTLFNSSKTVFDDIGGPSFGGTFDWGLPFFFGRTVFVGLEGRTSDLGTGPYWAY